MDYNLQKNQNAEQTYHSIRNSIVSAQHRLSTAVNSAMVTTYWELLPFTMIGFGRYFMKKAPKEINSVFGYRTSMSMKNKDTWEFSHKYCGKVW